MTPPPDRPAATPSRERVAELLRDYVARVRTTAAQQRHLTDAAFLLVREKEDVARAALAAALASLADDAARMEWLESYFTDGGIQTVATTETDLDGFHIERDVMVLTRYDGKTFYGESIREAVDRALAAPPPEQEPAEDSALSLVDPFGAARSPIGETPEDPT